MNIANQDIVNQNHLHCLFNPLATADDNAYTRLSQITLTFILQVIHDKVSLTVHFIYVMFSCRWPTSPCKAPSILSPSFVYQRKGSFLKRMGCKMNSKNFSTAHSYDSPHSLHEKDHEEGCLNKSPDPRVLNDLKESQYFFHSFLNKFFEHSLCPKDQQDTKQVY